MQTRATIDSCLIRTNHTVNDVAEWGVPSHALAHHSIKTLAGPLNGLNRAPLGSYLSLRRTQGTIRADAPDWNPWLEVLPAGVAEPEAAPAATPRFVAAATGWSRPNGYSVNIGGQGGIRTHEHLLGCYSLSRRAPSTTRPPVRKPFHTAGGIARGYAARPPLRSGPLPLCGNVQNRFAILSNPRTPFRVLLTFQASAFDHSATCPLETQPA